MCEKRGIGSVALFAPGRRDLAKPARAPGDDDRGEQFHIDDASVLAKL